MTKIDGVNVAVSTLTAATFIGLSPLARSIKISSAPIIPPVPCTFPPQMELSNLDGTNGFTINGTVKMGGLGSSVSAAGDINHDGIDDVIIGAPFVSPAVAGRGTVSSGGQSYVVFGKPDWSLSPTWDVSNLKGDNGFALNGTVQNGYAGVSVSAAGDINHDGIDDVIIGAPDAFYSGRSQAGQSYVVFGQQNWSLASLRLSSLNGTNGFNIGGMAENDCLGKSVSAAGDINHDGIDDVVVGAYRASPDGRFNAGQSYVIFGQQNWSFPTVNLSHLEGPNGFTINGIASWDNSGGSVSAAGDINGDGIDDLILGAIGASPGRMRLNAGQSYVIFGKRNWLSPAVLELSSLNGTNGFILNGIKASDWSGWSVSGAGDVNHDGISDVIIGAPFAKQTGEGYVIFGKKNWSSAVLELSSLDGINGFTLTGYVSRVSGAGDVNNDGVDDVIVGADSASPHGIAGAGQSYVVFGEPGWSLANINLLKLNGTNGFALNGISQYDRAGSSVSAAGDINHDGIADILIGAFNVNTTQPYAGQSYVVFGCNASTNIATSSLHRFGLWKASSEKERPLQTEKKPAEQNENSQNIISK